jgi:hypothetical protein
MSKSVGINVGLKVGETPLGLLVGALDTTSYVGITVGSSDGGFVGLYVDTVGTGV